MKIDLSNHEVDMIDSALKAWQNEPASSGMLGSLIGGLLIKDDAERERHTTEQKTKTEAEIRHRERQCLLLRAKLMQASTINSEHELTVSQH